MGSCLSSLCRRSKTNKYSAYRDDLGAKLLKDSASELSIKSLVLVIRVKSIDRLPLVLRKSPILGLPAYLNCNCYVEMKLLHSTDNAIGGDQLQSGLIGELLS